MMYLADFITRNGILLLQATQKHKLDTFFLHTHYFLLFIHTHFFPTHTHFLTYIHSSNTFYTQTLFLYSLLHGRGLASGFFAEFNPYKLYLGLKCILCINNYNYLYLYLFFQETVHIYVITKCYTTTNYSFPLFSSLLKGELITKLVLNNIF